MTGWLWWKLHYKHLESAEGETLWDASEGALYVVEVSMLWRSFSAAFPRWDKARQSDRMAKDHLLLARKVYRLGCRMKRILGASR